MKIITLIAIAKFGLEQVVKDELIGLGYEDVRVENGRIEFQATLADIPRVNLWLRCADRVLLKMGEFRATTFDDLFEQTKALPWEQWITEDGKFTVNGKSVKSTLRSVRSCQSLVKKAVVDRLKSHYQTDWFEETGADFTIQISLLRDVALLTLDTSGAGLHKRGYRAEAGEAPLKETFAAGLVMVSQWQPDGLLIDPMCGSGTILIEAAMIARNIAPGLQREFASERWPIIDNQFWLDAREEAKQAQNKGAELQLFGYDIDAKAIPVCEANARNAGVAGDIVFKQKDVKDLWIDRQFGTIVSNPPYGMRMTEFKQVNQLYISLNKTFKKKRGWALNILTADDKFPDFFKRARPDRVLRFYNGRIPVNYYQYDGISQDD
ncbi:MAG: class I SAM-dependent RNA methyltransferase [Chloroflexi bacterium]|nr:class I SAM-dependent RNA methyltransferase [Chloroflexota bacterium]